MIIKYGVTIISMFIFILVSIHQAEGQNESGELKCVFLDAGHGGKDPGAIGLKTYEKHIVLPIVLKLGKMIEENYPDVKVVYSRQKDVAVDLKVRTKMANTCKADLFISVHANAVANRTVSGLETYILGTNDSEHNLQVAMKENSVIRYEDNYDTEYAGFDPSRAESYIMFNFLRNMHLDQSLDIASAIQKNLVKITQRKDLEEIEGCIADQKTVEDEIEARELARIIEAFLDTLTAKECVIFMRRYAYADTYADIAKRVGISEKNVSVRLTLIRQKMKQYLIEREVFV